MEQMDVEQATPLVEEKPLHWKDRLKQKWQKHKSLVELPIAAGLIVGWDFFVHNAWCGLMFKCGCTWDFHGGWNECNIHQENDIHCPWCAAAPSISWITTWGLMIMVFALYILFWKRLKRIPLLRITVGFVSYFFFSAMIGLCFKLASGYPHYFWYSS